jgi:hypothetical protein
MAFDLKGLLAARHGLGPVQAYNDISVVAKVIEGHPTLTNILRSLLEQRTMLEAEVSRLGYKVTRLESALAASQDALRQLRGY